MQEAKLRMEMDRDLIKEDVKRELEKAMAELQANKAQMEHDIQKALQDMKGQASSVEAQKEAQAVMEKAMKELQAREPEIRKNIEQAMKNLEGEMKDIESTFQKERAERERRIGYADQKWSKGDVKGSTTAKGRHYTRYGPPDEIETHPGKGENWLYRNWRGTGGKMIFEFDADGQLKR
jgi:GWxTD domain-containing protein